MSFATLEPAASRSFSPLVPGECGLALDVISVSSRPFSSLSPAKEPRSEAVSEGASFSIDQMRERSAGCVRDETRCARSIDRSRAVHSLLEVDLEVEANLPSLLSLLKSPRTSEKRKSAMVA